MFKKQRLGKSQAPGRWESAQVASVQRAQLAGQWTLCSRCLGSLDRFVHETRVLELRNFSPSVETSRRRRAYGWSATQPSRLVDQLVSSACFKPAPCNGSSLAQRCLHPSSVVKHAFAVPENVVLPQSQSQAIVCNRAHLLAINRLVCRFALLIFALSACVASVKRANPSWSIQRCCDCHGLAFWLHLPAWAFDSSGASSSPTSTTHHLQPKPPLNRPSPTLQSALHLLFGS
jgi:hypothetical protein